MDSETLVGAILIRVVIAKFIGFIGNRMYEVVLMMAEDEGGNAHLVPLVIGGLGWLGMVAAGIVAFKILKS